MIERKKYLEQLLNKKDNHLIKVITGVRRSGKSYLLFNLYKQKLLDLGVSSDHIICIQLDDTDFLAYRNPLKLGEYIRSQIKDNLNYYVFIDEIQFCKKVKNPYVENDSVSFYEVLNGLLKHENVDTYVTGSNSKLLSSDVLTEFRGRGDEIHVRPLSFKEFYDYKKGDFEDLLSEYLMYGGMPYVQLLKSDIEKTKYLTSLFDEIYLKDILERYSLKSEKELDTLVNVLASAIGSFTNPSKISATFKSKSNLIYSQKTIANHIGFLKDSFIISETLRYDVKGRKYIGANSKFYFVDTGLRNAKIGFRQFEITHLMENLIYNELLVRGFQVDVGIVEDYSKINGRSQRKQLEVDFIAKKGNQTYYIQSAYKLDSIEKEHQEKASLLAIHDSFQKIIITYDRIPRHYDDNGFLRLSLKDFLLNDSFFP